MFPAAAAETPPETTYVVSPIVVEAPRPDPRADILNRSGFVAVIDLTQRAGRVEDLAAVLSQLVGVRVTQYGGLGSFATVSIRGSSSSQVRTFLDGIPIDDPYLGVVGLADLPLGGVGRVEVYRGFSPPQLGGGAVGGAVHLVTRDDVARGSALSGAEAAVSAGSFDSRRQNGSLWLQPGRFRVFAHGTHEASRGDFEFQDDNGTPQNTNDDEFTTRANNDFDAWNGMVRASTSIRSIGNLALAWHDAARENGVPGMGSFQSTSARSERRHRMAHFRADGAERGRVRWSTDIFFRNAKDRFSDPRAEVSLVAQDTDNTLESYGGNTRARWYVPGLPVSIEGAFLRQNETFRPVARLPQPTEGPDRWRHSLAASLGADVYLARQTLVLTATGRFERHVDEGFSAPALPSVPPSPEGRVVRTVESPGAGARWHPVSRLSVKGNVGRYHRLPTFLELFGNTGSVTGSADLRPEAGVNRDLGVVINLSRSGVFRSVFVEVSRFDNEVENLILFFPNSQFTSKPANIGSARIRGWEISTAAAIGDRLEFAAGYTNLDTEDTSDIPYYRGNELPSRPAHDVHASMFYRRGPLRMGYELHAISSNWLDRANLRATPSRVLHGALVTLRTPVDGLSLSLDARNLTDERVTDVAGYPLPGRAVFSTLTYRY